VGRRADNLPIPLTAFIGREHEIAEVRRLLGTARLLTLTGTPGVGKTRLALEVAAGLDEAFPDGVWLVELAPLADPDLVPQAVATVLGVREQPGRDVEEALADALRSRRALLLIDNCEHLVDACAVLVDGLLRACHRLAILATSREPLGIAGETAWRVPSLALPDLDDPAAVGADGTPVLGSCAAVQLFVERASAARPDFALTALHAPAVARICRRLDGIPLALELAAARVMALSVEQVADRLDDRFRLLTGGNRTALPRQRTLRATVDWSYDLLAGQERALLRRLGIFAGGSSLEAAEAVCSGDGLDPAEVLDVLQHLVDRSLVVAEVNADGTNRYRMLEMLQQYASERLAESGEAEEVRRRHTAYFLALAERAEAELRGPREGEWSGRLEGEIENLRATLRRVIDRGEAEQAWRLGGALWRFWTQRGHLAEGLVWLEQMLALDADGDGATIRALRARAGALNGAGNLALARGENIRAAPFHEQALELRRRIGDEAGAAVSLHNLGMVARALGDPALAYARFEESLGLFRKLGDTRNAALSLLNLGRVSHDGGDHEGAAVFYREGLALFQQVGSAHGVATALNRLGDLARDRGEFATAERLHGEALSLRRGRGDPWVMGLSLTGLARVAAARRDHARTIALATQSLRALHEAGASRDTAAALVVLAATAVATDQAEVGARVLGAVARAYPEGWAIGFEQAVFEQAIASARAALGEAAFALAWDDGQWLLLDQAVGLGLSLAEPQAPSAGRPATTPTARPASDAAPSADAVGRPTASAGPSPSDLTRREREVAGWIARGLTNRQIGDQLVISEMTADSHVSHILRKLGFRSRAQVAAWAVEHGLTAPDPD